MRHFKKRVQNIAKSTIDFIANIPPKYTIKRKIGICEVITDIARKEYLQKLPPVKAYLKMLHSKGMPSTASDKDSQLFATLSEYSCSSRANFLTA